MPRNLPRRLQGELRQSIPFESLEAEAILNLHRSADRLQRQMQLLLKPYGLTSTQYNALRILRGAGGEGLSCGEIGERLVSHDPDITRLLNRLERQGLVERRRDQKDKRTVSTRITTSGLELLAGLDAVTIKSSRHLLGHMGRARLELLIDLLEEARDRCD